MISRESRAYWQELRKHPAFGAVGNEFNLDGLRQGMAARQAPANRDVKCIRSQIDDLPAMLPARPPTSLDEVLLAGSATALQARRIALQAGMPCEWVLAPDADPDLRLLYLHGGGYVSGSGANYLPLAAHISAAAQCAVLLPDYSLAPEHRFPAALEDCIRAHEWMIASGPDGPATAKATFIAGDSAGGGLTLATMLALRDRRRPLPTAGIPLSPFTDLTLASESIRSESENDHIMSARCLPMFVELYLGKTDPRNPLASPVFGDYTGIPPLLIQVGEYEIIRDDSVRVADKARSDGVEVQLEIWPGQVHVFQVRELPESSEAIGHIAGFMRSCLAR